MRSEPGISVPKAQNYIRAERNRFRRAAEGRAWSVKELPQFYYHRNFCEMLTHVSTRYTALMAPEHTAFIRDFAALPFAAQCAYARMAGRKGRVFNFHHLHYAEIKNIPEQFEVLEQQGFTKTPEERSEFKDYLSSLTKPELTNLLLDNVCETQFKRSWAKPRLLDIGLEHIDFDTLKIPDGVVVQSRLRSFYYLLYLYFGRIETSLQTKTLGELGLVRAPKTEPKTAQYKSYEQAHSAYFYAKALSDLKAGNEAAQDLSESVEDWPCPVDSLTDLKRGKLLQKLGGLQERQCNMERALALYGLNDNALCNERVIRIRYKRNGSGDRDWVQSRLEAMIENPESDEEHAFAEDFYARKYNKKRTSHVTDLLRQSETVLLDEAFKNSPERAALNHYKKQGFEAYRTENKPWRVLFGLLFWDEIYGMSVPQGWSVPDCLKVGTFYASNEAVIEAKLQDLAAPSKTILSLLKTFTKHYGTENGLFPWGNKNLDRVKALLLHSPKGALPALLRLMAQDFMKTKDGFPDLMVIEKGAARFVEVKAEGDVLRRNQLTRLRQLQSAGYQADILRVKWHFDPGQTYVVVDVETTGGRPGLHRVTEIGAVKLQGGEIIDEWSSLINPQRSIPPNITRITGIDEAMVAEAPLFADIADSFADFMGDAIFAAHNVNFDYGFISTEFEMIDRKFRHPKICTCSSMRKLYPGYRSYSLKNLCQEFQIDLKSHHRALCDAKAAAELLKMVNDKRVDMQD